MLSPRHRPEQGPETGLGLRSARRYMWLRSTSWEWLIQLKDWKKFFKEYHFTVCKFRNIQFHWSMARPIIYVRPMAAFALQQQSSIVLTAAAGSQAKTFAVGPFLPKACRLWPRVTLDAASSRNCDCAHGRSVGFHSTFWSSCPLLLNFLDLSHRNDKCGYGLEGRLESKNISSLSKVV